MTRYDEISKIALSVLDNAEKCKNCGKNHLVDISFKDKSIDDLIDILETTQEILADNTGDNRLTTAINIFRAIVHQELELRDKERYK